MMSVHGEINMAAATHDWSLLTTTCHISNHVIFPTRPSVPEATDMTIKLILQTAKLLYTYCVMQNSEIECEIYTTFCVLVELRDTM